MMRASADPPSGEQVLHLGVHIYLEANPNKGSQDRPKRDTISRCSAGRGGWGAQCHGPHPDGFALGRFALVLSPLTWTDQVGSMGSCPGIVRTVRVTHCALTWSNSPPSRPPRPSSSCEGENGGGWWVSLTTPLRVCTWSLAFALSG
jgi:hypothetical protein